MTIQQFIAGLEAAGPPVVVNVEPPKRVPGQLIVKQRFIFAPYAPDVPDASIEVEVIDDGGAGNYWKQRGAMQIRIRAAGTSHFIDLAPTTVSHDPGDVISECMKKPEKGCIIRSWTFEGAGSALGIGLYVSIQEANDPPNSGFLDQVFLHANARVCDDLPREYRFIPDAEIPKFGRK